MLVVRVKRRRDDDPAGFISVYEDTHTAPAKKRKNLVDELEKSMSLSAFSETAAVSQAEDTSTVEYAEVGRKRIILRRVSTLDKYNRSSFDADTLAALSAEQPVSTDEYSAKRARTIVTQSKRAIQLPGTENSCVMVDSMQIFEDRQQTEAAKTTDKTSRNDGKTKILDPATRTLAKGISAAVKRGDFNDIAAAMIQGGDADYQLPPSDGGYTALMAATMHGNVRMVKRLLLKHVDVTIRSSAEGKAAIDLLPKETRSNREDISEIRIFLQNAAMKQLQHRAMRERHVTSESNDFVVDIYTSTAAADSANADSSSSANANASAEQEEEIIGSLLHVEGLRFAANGAVELLAYDSDWSDLADDEDPDSNDERHFANDYPDEEDEDDGGRLFNNDDDEEDDEDEVENRQQRQALRQQQDTEQWAVEREIDDYLSSALGGSDGGGKGAGQVIFDQRRRAVGRVMRPFTMPESEADHSSSIPLFGQHTTESLQQLWGESETANDSGHVNESEERLQQMRQRTNMTFASDPREFDPQSGLPKYGERLSDDGDELMMDEEGYRPDRDAIAYDSELDHESEDDD